MALKSSEAAAEGLSDQKLRRSRSSSCDPTLLLTNQADL